MRFEIKTKLVGAVPALGVARILRKNLAWLAAKIAFLRLFRVSACALEFVGLFTNLLRGYLISSGRSLDYNTSEVLRQEAPTMDYCPKCGSRLRPVQVPGDDRERLVCTACSFVFYVDPKVAVCTIPALDGKILMVRRAIEPGYGQWVIPGGYIERGETVEEAAVRETLEESSVTVELGRLLNVYSYRESFIVVIVYTAAVVGGEPFPGKECLEARLFSPREIPWPQIAFRSTTDALRDWMKQAPALGV